MSITCCWSSVWPCACGVGFDRVIERVADLRTVAGRMEAVVTRAAAARIAAWWWSTTPTRPMRWTRCCEPALRPHAARPPVLRVRLRRRPRSRQAAADGRDRRALARPRGAHQRQPARRGRRDRSSREILAGMRTPDDRRVERDRRAAIRAGDRRGRRRRRGPDRRQGPRGLPGDRRPSSCRSATCEQAACRRWRGPRRRLRHDRPSRWPTGWPARRHAGRRRRRGSTRVSTDTRTPAPRRPVRRPARRPTSTATTILAHARAEPGAVAALVEPRPASTGCRACWSPTPRRRWATWPPHWRQRLPLPLIAVTGSNGKTTVKEMIAAILRRVAARCWRPAAT